MIATNRQPALRTLVPALLQCFRYGCAARTALRSAVGVNLYQCPTGPFCLVGQLSKETTPSCIINRLSIPCFRQPLNIYGLQYNGVVIINQLARNLMMKVASLVTHADMGSLKRTYRFIPPVASLLAAGYLALSTTEFGPTALGISWIKYFSTITKCKKVYQPK